MLLKLQPSIHIDLYPTTDRPTHPPTHSFLVVFLLRVSHLPMAEIEDSIRTNAEGPAKASGDAGSVEQHKLTDHDSGRQESRLRSDRDRGHASESASADLGIAGRRREASLHLHRDPLGVQPQDSEERARNPPLGRKDRVHRSQQNRNVSVSGRVNAILEVLQFNNH